MNSPTRIEVNAAIDALETKIDDLVARMVAFEERMTRFEERMTRFEDRLTRVEDDCRETRRIAFSLKSTIVTTAIISAITIIIGLSALTSAMHTNMINAFSSGKETALAQADLRRQSDETAAILRDIRRQLDAKEQR